MTSPIHLLPPLLPILSLICLLSLASADKISMGPPPQLIPLYPQVSFVESFVVATDERGSRTSGVSFANVGLLGYEGYDCLHDVDKDTATECLPKGDTITLSYVAFKETYACGRMNPSNFAYDLGDCLWSQYGLGLSNQQEQTYFCCKEESLGLIEGCTQDNLDKLLIDDALLASNFGVRADVSAAATRASARSAWRGREESVPLERLGEREGVLGRGTHVPHPPRIISLA
jgi:hypothetical protein